MKQKLHYKVEDLYSKEGLNERQIEARTLALNDLNAFIRLVAPYEMMGHCHIELCKWLRKNDESNRLVLWPRDHKKSRTCAFYAAWKVVRNPAITIIYASATAEKAEEQLRFIKDILTSDIAFKYFPELVNRFEGQRTAWNMTNIIVDHPFRRSQGVVDSTIMTCGLEKTITGKHCDVLVCDDIVVPENNTDLGRRQVNGWLSQAASVTATHGVVVAVGTRYHPKDAYGMAIEMVFNEKEDMDGNPVEENKKQLFIVNQANVEYDGDFLWPRQQGPDGRWFGFNETILSKKRSVYEASGEITQFFAQYYNDPNDKTTAPISRDMFQYYDRDDLEYLNGMWELNGEPLHIYAALDLATGVANTADYCALLVGGIDRLGNRYVLQAYRYRTSKISQTLSTLIEAYQKWMFKKLRIESVSGFRLVAEDLEDSLHSKGIRIPIDFYFPPKNETKPVRVNGILEPLYQAGLVYHYRGGNCQIMEDELCSINPAYDDLKDAWAMCNGIMAKPIQRKKRPSNVVYYHPRFGGVRAA